MSAKNCHHVIEVGKNPWNMVETSQRLILFWMWWTMRKEKGKLGIFYRREKTRVRNNTQHEKRKRQLEQNGKDNEWEVERMLTLDVLSLVSAT
jgi:hypothetical protein